MPVAEPLDLHWYVCFSVEVETIRLPHTDKAVGIDLGLTTFAALSNYALLCDAHLCELGRTINLLKQFIYHPLACHHHPPDRATD